MPHPLNVACIIDDDDTFVFLVKHKIAKGNLCQKIISFENGRVALDGLLPLVDATTELPDVILLDINMPEMDGWEFLENFTKIRTQIEKPVTIYMVSSSIDENDIQRARGYEAVADYKVKPIDTDTLRQLFVTVA